MLERMNEQEIKNLLDGKELDFYLEDDMFELEGSAKVQDDKIIVKVLSGVSHMKEIAGDFLEITPQYRKVLAERSDKSRTFQMLINRVYERFKDPKPDDFTAMKEQGIKYFFKKPTDTLIWFAPDENKWFIELNKINMFFRGNRKSYPSIQELYEENQEYLSGEWQVIYYSPDIEDELKNEFMTPALENELVGF